MRRSDKEEVRRWLETAKEDLETAKGLITIGRYPIACFMAQQSAEKAMKAFLYSKGEGNIRGHSVFELSEKAESHDSSFNSIQPSTSSIDSYYLPTRYPNSLPGGTPYDIYGLKNAQDAIKDAEEIVNFILERVKIEDNDD